MRRKVSKRVSRRSRSAPKRKSRGAAKSGALYVVTILGVVLLFGVVTTGGVAPTLLKHQDLPPPAPLYTCCDSGDGTACHPILETQITYNSDTYGLLRTGIYMGETGHIAPATPPQYTPDGHRIFINESDTKAIYTDKPGCEHGKDLIAIKDPTNPKRVCFGIPNDELIYVCKDTTAECAKDVNKGRLPFDVYFRLKDGAVPPEIASYCPKPQSNVTGSQQQVIGVPTPGGRKNLQLETFTVRQEQQRSEWLSPWCKPAINLYPKVKTQVHVEVVPKGAFTLTIPQYPKNGWDVTAYPDGKIDYQNATYPYLYWEASLPDNLIKQPQDGYVVAYSDLPELFGTVLPQLGLNEKERSEFSSYWLKALPKSPYYFVGVVPESEVNQLAPLKVQPAPDSLLRVTLYFKAVDKMVSVSPPQLSGFNRSGFTVTEWGGFFKADKNHPGFTCLM